MLVEWSLIHLNEAHNSGEYTCVTHCLSPKSSDFAALSVVVVETPIIHFVERRWHTHYASSLSDVIYVLDIGHRILCADLLSMVYGAPSEVMCGDNGVRGTAIYGQCDLLPRYACGLICK